MPVDESTPGVETVRKGVGSGATEGALEHAAKSAPLQQSPPTNGGPAAWPEAATQRSQQPGSRDPLTFSRPPLRATTHSRLIAVSCG